MFISLLLLTFDEYVEGLHFGLLTGGQHADGAQPIACPSPQQGIGAVTMQQPMSAPSSLGFLSDSQSLRSRSSSTQCLLSSSDQHDFLDDMRNILEQDGNHTWHGAGHFSTTFQPMTDGTPQHGGNRLLQPPSMQPAEGFQYIPEVPGRGHCCIEDQHKQQNDQSYPMGASFDCFGDGAVSDGSLNNFMNYGALGSVVEPMDTTQNISDLPMASRLL